MTNILDKEHINKIYHTMIRHLNLFVIAMLIGMTIGFKIAGVYLDYRIEEAVKLQGFIYKGTIYEIKIRP